MTTEAGPQSTEKSPDERMKDILWELGRTDPSLRDVISRLTLFLSSDNEVPEIGQRLKSLREAAGLNKKDLAESSGVDASTICRIENGSTQKVRGEVIVKLKKILPDL